MLSDSTMATNNFPHGYSAAVTEKLQPVGPVKWWSFNTSGGGTYDVLRYRHGDEKNGFATAWRLVKNTNRLTKLYPKTLTALAAVGAVFSWMYFDDKRERRNRNADYDLKVKAREEYDRGFKAGMAHVGGDDISYYDACEYRPLITYLRGQRRQVANEQAAQRMREDLKRSFPEIVNKI